MLNGEECREYLFSLDSLNWVANPGKTLPIGATSDNTDSVYSGKVIMSLKHKPLAFSARIYRGAGAESRTENPKTSCPLWNTRNNTRYLVLQGM